VRLPHAESVSAESLATGQADALAPYRAAV
jgi:hypothetical protein